MRFLFCEKLLAVWCCCFLPRSHAYGRTSAPLFPPCETVGFRGYCTSVGSTTAAAASGAAAACAADACTGSQWTREDSVVGRSPTWKLLLLDLRPQWLFEGGRLPPAIHVDALGDWKQTLPALVGAIDPSTTAATTAVDGQPTRSSLSEYLRGSSCCCSHSTSCCGGGGRNTVH